MRYLSEDTFGKLLATHLKEAFTSGFRFIHDSVYGCRIFVLRAKKVGEL